MRIGGGLGLGGMLLVLALSYFTGRILPISSRASTQEAARPASPALPPPTNPAGSCGSSLQTPKRPGTPSSATWVSGTNRRRWCCSVGRTESACGLGQSAMGPFYCPRDHNVYLDLTFFDELDRRFGAPGDFAQAYVVAHEVGHHVQLLTGLAERVDAARRGASQSEANALSVRQELQADCYAGIWGFYASKKSGLVDTV